MGLRAPLSIIWKEVYSLATGDTITRENTWRDGINRAADIGYGVLSALFSFRQDLGSYASGTRAIIRSPNLITELSYYDAPAVPVGALDGLTLNLEDSGVATPITVTFSAPTSPADVVVQINAVAVANGVQASLDDGWDPTTQTFIAANVGKLRLQSVTPGATTLYVRGTGTANGVLGFPGTDTSATGSATVSDGASRIGVGAFSGYGGGDLRTLLQAIVDTVETVNVEVQDWRADDADKVLTDTAQTILVAGAVAAPRTYTFPAPVKDGRVIRLRRKSAAGTVSGAGPLDETVSFPAATARSYALVSFGGTWYVLSQGS
jgi:hypothetical protein